MDIKKVALCGTLLSNDCLISIAPGKEGIELEIESPVKEAFGEQIEKTIREKLKEMGITSCLLKIEDKGALDFTISARVETVVRRANE